jgi:ribosomal protein S6--L-glutamate ligase
MTSMPTIAMVAERRHLENQAIKDARLVLQAAGCAVPLVVPQSDGLYEVFTSAPQWDAVLSRGRDLVGLGIVAAAAALGVVAINTPQSIELVRNKIAMQAVLLEHGLPMPRTWFAADPTAFKDLPGEHFPVVVKPYDGDGSSGLFLLAEPSDVDFVTPPKGARSVFLAQEYIETDGWDLKLYGIGAQVWAVRKRSPISLRRPGPAEWVQHDGGAELVELDARLRDIAFTSGRACGLELWGVDIAMRADGPYVIEVNDFPTYSAVPGAGQAIAEHALRAVQMASMVREAGRGRLQSVVRDVM